MKNAAIEGNAQTVRRQLLRESVG